jgi:glycosyltransferase involved in cell wall biosynthesis
VIIEAAACGIPSIAYRIDGVIDAIVDGRTGLFVDKGDIQGLSDAMNRLGAESSTRKTLGEAAHLRASSEFSSASVSKAWLDFYLSVLRGKA